MNLTKKHKILIIGLGLIGGSYAEALTSWGFEVGAITKDRDSIDFSKEPGKSISKRRIINSGPPFFLFKTFILESISQTHFKISSVLGSVLPSFTIIHSQNGNV